MKKVFAIIFSVVVLISGMTLNYSAHYCEGKFIASRLSLSGENANCGMNTEKGENKGSSVSNLMCVNEITSVTFSSDYVSTHQVHDAGKILLLIEFPVQLVSTLNLIPDSPVSKNIQTGPPGLSKPENDFLCVFRI